MKQPNLFSRRRMLEMGIGLSGFALSGTIGSVLAQEANRRYTPQLTSGPFYPLMKPLDQDADLTVIAGKQGRAQGKVVHLMGRVLNEKGEPVSGARVEIWQANTHGRYAHQSDPNPAPLDPNFEGYGVQNTDAEGRYRFKTIKPGAYPGIFAGMRAPHIHFQVTGQIDRIVTQVLFPNEPLNETDNILQALRGRRREAVIAKLMPPTKEFEAASLVALWDIILIKG
jgi:protocatechuate 3,4-dioxygenase beta subunit